MSRTNTVWVLQRQPNIGHKLSQFYRSHTNKFVTVRTGYSPGRALTICEEFVNYQKSIGRETLLNIYCAFSASAAVICAFWAASSACLTAA